MLKKLISLVSIVSVVCYTSIVSANSISKKATYIPQQAIVFYRGAQITGEVSVSIPEGISEIVIDDLPSSLSENQLQVKGEGDFIIQSVVRKMNYLNENELPKEIRVLKDSLEGLNATFEKEAGMEKIYNQEEEILLANKTIGGENTGVNMLELEKVINFMRNRLTDLQKKRIESQQKQRKLQEKIDRIQSQLNELYNNNQYNSSTIVVNISAKGAQKAKLMLSYFVNDAGWVPYYDIRSQDINSPLKLEYKAHVWQNTGKSWDKIKLSLSTGNPFVGNNKPEMQPSRVDFKPIIKVRASAAPQKIEMMYEADAVQEDSMEPQVRAGMMSMANAKVAETASAYTTVSESSTNIVFEIAIPYTIPSDGKQYSVSVQENTMAASYKYYAAPKLDKDAFLVAYVPDWSQYNLVSANANIYYQGMFVGKSYINTSQTKDTLEISLGRDKSIAVTRERMKDFTEKKVIGITKKETHTYEIAVKNNKKQDVEIIIQDQIPVSANKDIVVEIQEKSRAEHDAEKGFLIWNMKVKAGASEKVKFSYTIQYPSDKAITGM